MFDCRSRSKRDLANFVFVDFTNKETDFTVLKIEVTESRQKTAGITTFCPEKFPFRL